MRILYVVNEWDYFRRHRESLALAMADAGHEVVVAAGEADDAPASIHDGRVRVEALRLDRHRFRPLGDTGLVLQIRRLVREFDPDVVHAITIKPILYTALASLGPPWTARMIWTFPGLGKIFEPGQSRAKTLRRLAVSSVLARVARSRDASFTFENEDDRDTFVRAGIAPAGKAVRVEGTGIDLERFAPAAKPENGQPGFLFASRLIRAKGVDTFLAVARACKASARFIVAGLHDASNPDAFDIRQIEEAHDEGIVEFVGAVQTDDMPALYASADAAVLPTRLREGLPRSLLEAAACGTALIASDQPAIREIVRPGQTGWLLDPPDADGLLRAVREAVADPERLASMGGNARALVVAGRYSDEAVAERFALLYRGDTEERAA